MPVMNWLNKGEAVKSAQKVPYRLLEGVPELSHGDPSTDNMLIQGDNLEALKALLPLYAGKCLFLMSVEEDDQGRNVFQQIDDLISRAGRWSAEAIGERVNAKLLDYCRTKRGG